VIFGPGDGLFFRFAALLALSPVLPLAKPGAKFAPVYVLDVVQAFLRALEDRSTIGRTYEIYGPAVMTLREIVAYTARHRGLRRLIIGLPDPLGRLQAALFDFVPGKPFSSDNWKSLQIDSVGGIDGLYQLGIDKTPVDAVMPALLSGSPRQARLDRCRALR
jgi:NADH dehydrogenase